MTVGQLLRDPVKALGLHGAEPVGAEAEDVAVERIFGGLAVNLVANVDDARADGVGGGELGRSSGLDEAYLVAFGIFRLEPAAAVACRLHFGGALDAMAVHVGTQAGSV